MPFILIDRRKAGKGKSAPNRQKLIKRIKSYIKQAVPQNVGQGGVGGQNANMNSPIKVAGNALEEPWFAYARGGLRTHVIIGNTEYDRGDEIDFPEDDAQGSAGGNGGNGEDDFIVNVARDEFLDLFFEDCELPNLTNEKYTEKLDNTQQPAGFSTNGTPAQLSIIRTFKQSLGRRKALMGPYQEEKIALEAELSHLKELWPAVIQDGKVLEAELRIAEIEVRLEELAGKFIYLDNFDKSDLRYRKKEAKPLKTVDAVLIMLMDVSGSMDENRKTIGRRWFALMYAFIKRRYANTELVFIAHTTEPFEMNEDDFFSTRMNGGTMVSPALKMVNNIIKERYNPNETNIYVSHASDGDNWGSDGDAVVAEMGGPGYLMNKLQMFSYVEVGKRYSYAGSPSGDTDLWNAYELAQMNVDKSKLQLTIIETADDCYPIFKKVFKKVSK
jgi:uncharacterized sporulation protein YeaH/YhbH (DUF444 family)